MNETLFSTTRYTISCFSWTEIDTTLKFHDFQQLEEQTNSDCDNLSAFEFATLAWSTSQNNTLSNTSTGHNEPGATAAKRFCNISTPYSDSRFTYQKKKHIKANDDHLTLKRFRTVIKDIQRVKARRFLLPKID